MIFPKQAQVFGLVEFVLGKAVDRRGELVANASYVYQSRVTFAGNNFGLLYAFQNGFGLVNMRTDWNNFLGKTFDVGLYVKNLTDKVYALERDDLTAAFGFVSTVYNDPRTYGIDLRWRFGK